MNASDSRLARMKLTGAPAKAAGTRASARRPRQRQAFAQAGKDQQHQREAKGGAKTIDQALEKTHLLLDGEQRQAEHRAVGGDQRQVDAERLIQRRRRFLDDHLDELHGRRDDQDEGENPQIAEIERRQQPVLEHPGGGARQGDDEGRGKAHPQRAVHVAGDPHEWTKPEKFHQHHVVHQRGRKQQQEISGHCRQAP